MVSILLSMLTLTVLVPGSRKNVRFAFVLTIGGPLIRCLENGDNLFGIHA